MKKFGFSVLILAVAIYFFLTVFRTREAPVVPAGWETNYTNALSRAEERKLPVLFNFTGSDWCVWCILLEKEVFSTDEWKAYAKENLICVWLDFPNDTSKMPEETITQNMKLLEAFGVEGFPTLYISDSAGKVRIPVARQGISETPASFIRSVKEAITQLPSVETLSTSQPTQE